MGFINACAHFINFKFGCGSRTGGFIRCFYYLPGRVIIIILGECVGIAMFFFLVLCFSEGSFQGSQTFYLSPVQFFSKNLRHYDFLFLKQHFHVRAHLEISDYSLVLCGFFAFY